MGKYERAYKDEHMLVVNNFYGKETQWKTDIDLTGYECILGNYDNHSAPENGEWNLKPYESMIWYKQ